MRLAAGCDEAGDVIAREPYSLSPEEFERLYEMPSEPARSRRLLEEEIKERALSQTLRSERGRESKSRLFRSREEMAL